MNRTRYLAVGLLCLNGLLHVTRVGMAGLDATFVAIATAFGVAYLVLGVFLLRSGGTAATLGVIVPLAGIVVGIAGGLAGGPARPSPWMALLAALDLAIVLSCIRLVRARRRAPRERP